MSDVCLQAAKLKLRLAKCALLQQEVKYLEQVVSQDGITTNSEKLQVTVEWTVARHLHNLWVSLGLVRYYKQYIPGFAGVAELLRHLNPKGSRSGHRSSSRHLTTSGTVW